MRNTYSALVLLIVLLFSSNYAFGQLRVERVEVSPLNRATVYFNDFPFKHKSSLSPDKRKISVEIKSAKVAENARQVHSSGVIEDVYVQTAGLNLNISVMLKDAKGYTATPLPYSRALMIEAFDWKELSPAEDLYRTGLLGYEENILDEAKSDLLQAARAKDPNAAAMLGIILLKEGKINSALKNLQFAEYFKSTIPDMYAALSQIYSLKNDAAKSGSYSQTFSNLTGVNNFKYIEIQTIVEADTNCTEPVAHLAFVVDTVSNTAAVDTANKGQFAKLFTDSAKKDSLGVTDSLFSNYGYYAIAVIGGGLLLIVFFYFRWRNVQMAQAREAQLAQLTTSKKSKPKTEFSDKLSAAKQRVAKSRQKPTAKKPVKTIPEPMPEAEPELIVDEKPEPEIKTFDADHIRDVENLIESLRYGQQIAEEEQLETISDEVFEESYSDEPVTKTKPVNAKIEMAMHLAAEQQKIKNKNIESLKNKSFSADPSRLNEVAKQLGIEKGSLETKKAIDKMQNESSMAALQAKFAGFTQQKNDD